MGCFDYECACGGKSCEHVGGQLHASNVIIEVRLSDGTTVYLRGEYEEYGYVVVENYKFYPEQFRQFFTSWFDGESEKERASSFLAKRIWTDSEDVYCRDRHGRSHQEFVERDCFNYDYRISDLTSQIVSKCIRADDGLILDSEDDKKKKRAAQLKSQIEAMQRELKALTGH